MKTPSIILMSVAIFAWIGIPHVAAQDEGLIIEKIEPHGFEPINLVPEGTLTKRSFVSSKGVSLGYWIYEPGGQILEALPLIMYLHGASLRGNDLNRVLDNGLPRYLATRINIPAIVACPQCPSDKYWWDSSMPAAVDELITEILKTYPVDMKRISLTGHSMGGDGTWVIGSRYPERYARLLPVSGSYRDAEPSRFRSIPIWTFVAETDNYLIERINTNIATKLKSMQGNVRMTIVIDTVHGTVPNSVYRELAVLEWLMCR